MTRTLVQEVMTTPVVTATAGLCPGFGSRRRERCRALARAGGELMTAF